jgi:predicted ATPase/DNA-binding XRE family transcriptional regulator
MEPTTFGDLLKRSRMAAGLTQEALAERANLSTRAVSDLERGLSRTPRYDTLDLLARALNIEAAQRSALFAAARPSLPMEDAKAVPLHVLPYPPTALLGREQEVAQACDLLRERGVRLLTLSGPGGVGKTRLALEIAHNLRESFADGLAWIDLTSLRDPSLVAQTVSHVLGLREQADRPLLEQVRSFLKDKQCLLLLDNFEQVREAAHFMADLLMNCPRLQVLVTSRVPLHLRAEQQLMLTPLAHTAAVALFLERARQVQPGLDDNEQMVAAICDQLDRLPLAIELAAAHVRVLSLPVLLERLSQRLLLLRAGARDLPERQRTMREAIGWSYNLLTATQQRWFRALAVFMGGCQLAAAEAICQGEESLTSDDGLSAISALVDASLVQVETMRDGLPRYRMLEVIREYGVEQLRAAGEEDLYQRRHAEYYAELAEEAERVGPSQGSREVHLDQESANGRAALHWSYEREEVALGLRLAAWFGLFWLKRGQMSEGSMWLERMLALGEVAGAQAVPPAVRSRACYNAARLAMHLGSNERAKALAREALALAKQTGDQFEITHVLATLGSIALASGKEDEAGAYFTESYEAAKRADDAGDARPIGLALLNLGELARKRGEFAYATVLLEEALARTRALDMTWGIANISTLLGHLARQEQGYERAKRRYQESLRIYQRLGNATYTAWCLEGIAAVSCAEGSYERATRLAAAAAVLRRAAHTPLPLGEQEDFDKVVMTARAELDESVFTQQWDIGSTLTQDDAISYALQWLPA